MAAMKTARSKTVGIVPKVKTALKSRAATASSAQAKHATTGTPRMATDVTTPAKSRTAGIAQKQGNPASKSAAATASSAQAKHETAESAKLATHGTTPAKARTAGIAQQTWQTAPRT